MISGHHQQEDWEEASLGRKLVSSGTSVQSQAVEQAAAVKGASFRRV